MNLSSNEQLNFGVSEQHKKLVNDMSEWKLCFNKICENELYYKNSFFNEELTSTNVIMCALIKKYTTSERKFFLLYFSPFCFFVNKSYFKDI